MCYRARKHRTKKVTLNRNVTNGEWICHKGEKRSGKVKKIQSDDDDAFGWETTLDVSNYNGAEDVLGIRRREHRDYMAKRGEGKKKKIKE